MGNSVYFGCKIKESRGKEAKERSGRKREAGVGAT
jgi:hypothetical protein